jgi:hypothetical protein
MLVCEPSLIIGKPSPVSDKLVVIHLFLMERCCLCCVIVVSCLVLLFGVSSRTRGSFSSIPESVYSEPRVGHTKKILIVFVSDNSVSHLVCLSCACKTGIYANITLLLICYITKARMYSDI